MKKSQFIGSLFRYRFFQGYGVGIVFSVMLHGLIILLLSVNWNKQSEMTIVPPRSIRASVVEVPETAPPKPVFDDSAARQRAREQARKKQQQETERAKAEALRREELRQKEIALKKKQQVEEKARQERLRKEKEEAARQERLRLKAEAERRQAEKAAADRQKQQRAAAAEQAEKDMAVANHYSELLTELFVQHWNRPPSARNNMTTVVQLMLSPYGDLLEVRLLKSSGNDAYDLSVVQAVKRAAPFPELKTLERRVFNEHFKRINFKFRPEDLVR